MQITVLELLFALMAKITVFLTCHPRQHSPLSTPVLSPRRRLASTFGATALNTIHMVDVNARVEFISTTHHDGYSRFHNDRHPRFLLVYVLFGSIGESGAKEALADNLPWRITPTERLPHASEH